MKKPRRQAARRRSSQHPWNRTRLIVEQLECRIVLSATAGHDHDLLVPSYQPPTVTRFALDGPLSEVRAGVPNDIALSYFHAEASQFGLLPGDAINPFITSSYSDGVTGVSYAYFTQQFNGLPVTNAVANFAVNSSGQIVTANSSFVGGLSLLADDPSLAPMATMTAANALVAVLDDLDLNPISPPNVISFTGGLDQAMVFDAPGASLDPIPAHLVYAATPDGVRLAWDYVLRTPDGDHWYNIGVDAATGELLLASDWVDNLEAYNIYSLPGESPNDGGRDIRVNPAHAIPSPFGWHDTNGGGGAEFTDTRGNNVSAQEDADADNAGGFRPTGGAELHFDFPINLAQAPDQYISAAVTNLFYWNNILHDVHYQYGFTSAAGNFQVNTYGQGGLGDDAVQADAQDGSGTNNANFATPPDGIAPRMQQFIWTAANPDRASDLDNGVIIHEYGHGVSNRLTGGPANSNALNALQSGGMGEGWSDWWALMLTQRPTDVASQAYPIGTYLLNQPATGPGIRRQPYSFDMSINNQTFALYNASQEVHDAGELWCSALWDMNWLLIDKYGYDQDLTTGFTRSGPGAAGNKVALRLVMDALKLQPANPSFIEGRDAILTADVNLTGGVNQREIWTAFARRGLGFSATTVDSNATFVTTAFDLPPELANPGIIAMTPAATTNTAPATIDFTFSEPMNPASFDPAADILSFTGPGGVDLEPLITSTSFLSGDTVLRVNFTPQTAQGTYTLILGPDILDTTSNPMEQNGNDDPGLVPEDRFIGVFHYDAVVMQVNSPAAPTATIFLPITAIDVTFNEPYDPASIGADDLQLADGIVTGASVVNATTARYTVTGLTVEGFTNLNIKHGDVTDPLGFPVQFHSTLLSLDIDTIPFPTPLTATAPLGSRVYGQGFDGLINLVGDSDRFTIALEAGQRVTVVADAGTGLRPRLDLRSPTNTSLGTITAGGVDQDAVLQAITAPIDGIYTVVVDSVSSTVGTYNLRITLNAAVEAEEHNGATNNTTATAQNLNTVFTTLATGAQTAAVLGAADQSLSLLLTETEPNSTTGTANLASANFVALTASNLFHLGLTGDISGGTDTDFFNLGLLQAGDVITITQSSSGSARGSLEDSRVELYRLGSASAIAFSDDDGPNLDALIHRFTIPVTDTYFVRADNFLDGSTGTYELGILLEDNAGPAPTTGGTVTSESFFTNDFISVADDASTSWRVTEYLSRTSGTITAGDVDYYQYQFRAGDLVTIVADSTSGLDAQVALLSAAGATIAFEDGASFGPDPDSPLYAFIIPNTGTYFVRVQAFQGLGTYNADVYLSATTAPPPPTSGNDHYSITLIAGQSLSVAISALEPGNVDVVLLNAGGGTVATGAAGPTNVDERIANFTGAAGTYFVRVRGDSFVDYNLVLTRGASFDFEANDSFATAQTVNGRGALGFLDSGNDDWYSFTATAGQSILVRTTTPGGGGGEFVNLLDPLVELYSPANVLLTGDDNSASDGRNALLGTVAATTGTYRMRVQGAAGTSGEYFAEAAVNQFLTADVIDVAPDLRNTPVASITIRFSAAVSGLDLVDLTLTRDGSPNLLTGTESLTSVDGGLTWTLSGLAGLTSTDGTYELSLIAAASGIIDGSSNPLAADARDTFVVDVTAPTANIVAVSPDPHNSAVGTIAIVFDAAVAGFNRTDLSLTRNGGGNLLTVAQTLTTTDNITFTLNNLAGLTALQGNYVLNLTAAGSGITDLAGNGFVANASDAWVMDTAAPTANVIDVSPDPRNSPVNSLDIVFNEAVSGFDLADLRLTLNGGPNLLTGSQTLGSLDGGITWTLGNLTGLTGTQGNYLLTLTAAGSGIVDTAGNALAANATDAWVIDFTAPSVNIVDVAPDPRNTVVATMTITFDEAVTGLDIADLKLTLDGNDVGLTAAQTLTTGDNITFTLTNLAGLTAAEGAYLLTLNSGGSGIFDTAGNPLGVDADDGWIMDTTAPTADVIDVSPDPRNNNFASLVIQFDGPVTGFNLADLSLTRNGGGNLLTGSQTLTSGDNITYTLNNLVALTGLQGTYLLSLTAAGSGIQDLASNALAANATDSWIMDTTPPTVNIVDISPDPRATPVNSVTIQFNEAVIGLDLADLSLTRNAGPNLLTGGETLTTGDNITFTLGNLSGLTTPEGTYLLSLTAAGSGIQDPASNPLAAGATDSWVMDVTPPTVDVIDVSPDPRTSTVGSMTIVFSEVVSGFNLADLTLTHNGGANLLTGSQSLTTSNNITFTLNNLAGLTAAEGTYLLTLTAVGSGILDTAFNALGTDATDTWIVDTTAPTVNVIDVSPDPRNSSVSTITIQFNEAVNGLDLADLRLTRNGGVNLLSGAQTLTTSDNITWTLDNLTGLTALAGTYLVNLTAAGSGIQDLAANALVLNANDTWFVDTTVPTVNILDVTPDPRNSSVSSIIFQFSEAVNGFDLADLSLTRDGGINLLTGAETLTTTNNIVFSLNNLSGLTAAEGNYLLSLTASGSSIIDASSNALAGDAADAWFVDATAPTVTIIDVTPDPRNAAVNAMTIVFSEAVTGFDVADLRLTRNGGTNLLTGSQTLATSDNITFTLTNLGGLTLANGTYLLTLTAAGSGIVDQVANALSNSDSDSWFVDATAPTVDIIDVTPDPRNSSVASITIVFSEAVTGFDLADLSLIRNGGANLLTGAQTLTTGDNITYTLGNLSGLTLADGNYLVSLNAAGSGIMDIGTNLLAASAADAWFSDAAAPTVNLIAVTPDPRNAAVPSMTFIFSEAVTGFNRADLSLTRDGGGNLLSAAQTLTTSDNITFTLTNLAGLTTPEGNYLLSLTAAGSGIQDLSANLLATDAADAWLTDTTVPTVLMTSTRSEPTNTSPILVTATFSEDVTGFTAADVVRSNATLSNFSGSGAVYTFTLNPIAPGLVTADIAASSAIDRAANPNTAAPRIQRSFLPPVRILGLPGSSPEGVAIQVVSDNQPAGFDLEWLVTRNGAPFAQGAGPNFSFTPNDNAAYEVQLVSIDPDGTRGIPVTQALTVTNVAPTLAGILGPTSGKNRNVATFSANANDAGQDGLTFRWTFTKRKRRGKKNRPLPAQSGQTITFTPREVNTYTITVTATDKDGAVSESISMTFKAKKGKK